MQSRSYSTRTVSDKEVKREWFIVDADGATLGRMTTKIASVLRGKHKPTFTPNMDCGDYVIVLNAEKVVFTGKKAEQKQYINYSGYPGGKKEEVAEDLLKRRPEVIMERAVKGMLPKNRLGRKMIKKLFVYAGSTHSHSAQQPKELKF